MTTNLGKKRRTKIEKKFTVTFDSIKCLSISNLMNEVNAKSAVWNLYYLLDDFRSTENFDELFIETANNSFGFYIVYWQIYFRVFLNTLRGVTDFVTERYLLEAEIKKNFGETK